jgi:hypothetical protein
MLIVFDSLNFSDMLPKPYTALLREDVARPVSDPAAIDEEIHSLFKALVASKGRLNL